MSQQPEAVEQPQRAPRGTWSGAFLVTDYFSVENRLRAPVKWRIRTTTLRRIRRRVAEVEAKVGRNSAAERPPLPRPGAGQPITGPLPVERPAPYRRPAPTRLLAPRPDFRVPSEQLIVPGLTWRFRAGLDRREPDLTPLFDCIGLIRPGKEA